MAVVSAEHQEILSRLYWYTPEDVASMPQEYADELILRATDPTAAQQISLWGAVQSVTYGTGLDIVLSRPALAIEEAAEDIGDILESVLKSIGGAAGRGLAVSLAPLLPFAVVGLLVYFFAIKR